MENGVKNTTKTPKKRPVSGRNGQPVPVNKNGRPKGSLNKRTVLGRQAIADFVDGNADKLAGWLDQVSKKDPESAFKLFMSVVEYHIPKLQRQEMQNLDKNGQAIDPVSKITIEHVSVKKDD